ncbi:MAG: patatin-like phospholipase family protein [Thermoplasmata archaeon]
MDGRETRKSRPKYKNLVLSGGSAKGIAHIGAIRKLVDEKLVNLENLESIAGVSVGALIALLISLRFSIEEIWNFILSIDLKKIVNPDIFMLIQKCGVDTGQIIYNLCEEILTKRTGIAHITFKQLYDLTKIHIIMVGSCLTTKDVVYFDHCNTPNFRVSVAARISISMPGYFTPVVVGEKKYIDGAILNNYPMNLFKNRIEETVGIIINSDYNTNYQYPEEYFIAVINLFLHNYYKRIRRKYKNNTIFVNNVKNISIFDFDLDMETKKRLYQCGMEAAEEFVKKVKNENSGCE